MISSFKNTSRVSCQRAESRVCKCMYYNRGGGEAWRPERCNTDWTTARLRDGVERTGAAKTTFEHGPVSVGNEICLH